MKTYKVNSLLNLLEITSAFKKKDTLFRGQENSAWNVESKLLRSTIDFLNTTKNIKLNDETRTSIEFHQYLLEVIKHKKKTYKPSKKLQELCIKNSELDIDFEILKLFQQFEDSESSLQQIKGTHLVDWSNDPLIALYFAVDNTSNSASQDAVIYIYNYQNTPNIIQSKKLQEIEVLMENHEYKSCLKGMLPIIFHPAQIISDRRSKNQKAVYVAQMDFRVDLIHSWESFEFENNINVISKIIISSSLKEECNKYLTSNGYNKNYIYPSLFIN